MKSPSLRFGSARSPARSIPALSSIYLEAAPPTSGGAKHKGRKRLDLGLTGNVAVITGASRGLGKAIAKRFIAEGAHVAIVARNQETLDQAAAELSVGGGQVLTVSADIGDLKSYHGSRGRCSKALRSHRYPRQQCRHPYSRHRRRHDVRKPRKQLHEKLFDSSA